MIGAFAFLCLLLLTGTTCKVKLTNLQKNGILKMTNLQKNAKMKLTNLQKNAKMKLTNLQMRSVHICFEEKYIVNC